VPRFAASLVAAVVYVVAAVVAGAPAAVAAPEDVVAIVGGRVIPVTGPEIESGTVVVRDGKIVAVGPSASVVVPDGATVIHATGRFVMPGIIDTHSHMGVYPWAIARGSADGNEATEPLTPFVRAEDSVYLEDPAFERARAGGCTTVHVIPGSANLMGGEGVVLKLKPVNTLAEMKVASAPRTLKMAFGENPKRVYGEGKGRTPSTRMGNVAVLREAFREANEYRARWKQWAQRPDAIPRPEYDPTLTFLLDVLSGEVRLHIHCYRKDDILAIFRLQDEFGLKVAAIHHAVESYKVAAELAARKIGVCTWADWWGFKMESWDAIPQCAGMIAAAGATLSIHSDSSDGVQRLHHEAAKAVRWGLAPDAALAAVTIGPARLLGIDGRTGSLEVGKDADIAVFTRHPLDMYALCEWTLIDGKVVYRRERVPKVEPGLPMPAIAAGPARPPESVGPVYGVAAPGSRGSDIASGHYAIVGATLVPVSAPPIPNGVLIISNGKISALGRADEVPVPKSAWVVDAKGLYVVPGLIDCGTQLGLVEIASDPATHQDDEDSSIAVPHVRVADGFNPRSETIRVARLAGVTTALVAPQASGLVSGQSAIVDLNFDLNAPSTIVDEAFALHVNLGGPAIGRGRDRRAFSTRMGLVAELRELLVDAQEYRRKLERHEAEIKQHEERKKRAEERKARREKDRPDERSGPHEGRNGDDEERRRRDGEDRDWDDPGLPPSPPSRDLKLEALLPALEGKMPVVFRAQRAEDILAALDVAREFKLRPIISHGMDSQRVWTELRDRNVPVIYGPVNTQPESFETWGAVYETPVELDRLKIPFALQTASSHNVRLIPFMAGLAVAHGLPWERGLRAVTLGAAEVLGIEGRCGSLEVGKVANVAVFTGDPLQPLSRCEALFIRGSPVHLDSRQTELYDRFAPRAPGKPAGR